MWPLVLLLLIDGSLATPHDTNTIEHRVTWEQAHVALDNLNVTDLEGEGCKPCTDRQTGYCLSEDLIMDHCICDHRHIERLPYMEHTCYVPSRIHPTFASDCLEYVRLLECCCHASLLPLMREKARNVNASNVIENPPLLLQKVIETNDGVKERSRNGSTSARLASLILPVVLALRWTSALNISASLS